jgi:hypothetical protein
MPLASGYDTPQSTDREKKMHGRAQRIPAGLQLAVLLSLATPLGAQTIDDSLMMPGKQLCTGFTFTRDSWSRYWEGTLERSNGNIGTVTTQQVSWVASYGVTDRLNVIAMLPYVWTEASQGVLHGMHGLQDATVALKYQFLTKAVTEHGSLRAFAVASFATPVSDYTPDFYPLSIGSGSRRVSGRLTLDYQARQGFYLDATAAYTWRGDVTLDRPAYYTDGNLFLSDQVAMPDVIDYTVRAGYLGGGLQVPISFSQQFTLGGGDIRRQDAPFVSNRMDASRLDALVVYYLPKPRNLALRFGASYTLEGRNVGQATTFAAGLLYRVQF